MVSLLFQICCLLLWLVISIDSVSFTKVIIPSVYNEWDHGIPDWATLDMQRKFNYSVFLYQKTNASAPNYISTNRGTEGGVYLRYIVDHYESFPDVAVFVHAAPEKHSTGWLNKVNCIKSSSVSYFNINDKCDWVLRSPNYWSRFSIWLEQCWRDVLKIALGVEGGTMAKMYPATRELLIQAGTCQQFIMSRQLVHARPLEVWKQLHQMIAVDNVCHKGRLNFPHLHVAHTHKHIRFMSEESLNISENDHGQLIQGGTMEHLAHVVFGQQPLITEPPTMTEKCVQFVDESVCPGSPCTELAITGAPSVKPTVVPSVIGTSESDLRFIQRRDAMMRAEARARKASRGGF